MIDLSLVMPCTKRKRNGTGHTLDFHKLPTLCPDVLAREWLRASSEYNHVPARDLYCGAGWTSSLRAYEAACRVATTRLRIISAGYGLVTLDQLLPLYNATFASETNQVGRRVQMAGNLSQRHSAWWGAINAARGSSASPLADTLSDSACVMVAVGRNYFDAIEHDLLQLQNHLGPGQLWIISTGVPTLPALQPSLLPLSARIEYTLPGPRATLSQRVSEWLLREIIPEVGWDRVQIKRHLQQAERAADLREVKPKRDKSTDQEVEFWIMAQLFTVPQKSVSSLLADYRASGQACEANRFRRLCDGARSQASLSRKMRA